MVLELVGAEADADAEVARMGRVEAEVEVVARDLVEGGRRRDVEAALVVAAFGCRVMVEEGTGGGLARLTVV